MRNAASASDLLRRKISDNGPTSNPAGLNQASYATLCWATSDKREWGWGGGRGLELGLALGEKKGTDFVGQLGHGLATAIKASGASRHLALDAQTAPGRFKSFVQPGKTS